MAVEPTRGIQHHSRQRRGDIWAGIASVGSVRSAAAAYLDAAARHAISSFAHARDVAGSLARLKQDLSDGTWMRRNGHLLDLSELDLGYRLILAARA